MIPVLDESSEEIDHTRECDQCGFRPWISWKSWRCPLHYGPGGSCDGKLIFVSQSPNAPVDRPSETRSDASALLGGGE